MSDEEKEKGEKSWIPEKIKRRWRSAYCFPMLQVNGWTINKCTTKLYFVKRILCLNPICRSLYARVRRCVCNAHIMHVVQNQISESTFSYSPFLDLSFVYPVPSLLPIVCSASCWHTVCQSCYYRCVTGFCSCHYYCHRSIQLNLYFLFQFFAWICASVKKRSKMLLYV